MLDKTSFPNVGLSQRELKLVNKTHFNELLGFYL